MAAIRNILYSMLSGMIMVSCSTGDGMSDELGMEQTAKQVDLLMSIGNKTSQPRQAPTPTHRAPTFTEMDLLVAIPYRTNGANVTANDAPLIDLVGAMKTT